MNGWITDRKIGWIEWKLHNLRFRLIKLLAGRDGVAVNLTIGRNGAALTPTPGRRLFVAGTEVAE